MRYGRALGWSAGTAGTAGVAAWRLGEAGLLAEPFRPYADQTFQAVLVQRAADPSLYRSDAMITALDGFWPDGWFRLLGWMVRPFADLETGWSAVTLMLAVVFLGGLIHLGWRLTGSLAVGGLVALATATLTRDSFIGEWGVVPVIPRFAVLAFWPWLFAALAPDGSRHGRRAAFLVAGLLAWVHPLTAFQVVLCMGSVLLLTSRGARRLRRLRDAVLLAGLGAVPALFNLPALQGATDLEQLRHTSFAYYLQPPLYKAAGVLVQWALLAAVAAWGWGSPLWTPRSRRFLVALGGSTLVLSMLHPVTTLHARSLALAPLRFLVFLFPVFLLLGAAGVVPGLTRRGLRRRLVALAGLALLLLPVSWKIYYAVWHHVPWIGRHLDASLAARPGLFQGSLGLQGREGELRALGEEIRRQVGTDEVILAPPRGASTLRLFSRRALYVAAEDSVLALYDAQGFAEFQRRMTRADQAFGDASGRALRDLAREAGIRWVVVTDAGPVPGPVRAEGAGLRLVGPLDDA